MILRDICHVEWGNTDLTKTAYVERGKYLAVSAAGCDGRIEHYEHEANVPVLSAIGAQCGKMFFPSERFTAIKNTITLTPKPDTLGKYLYYLFSSINLPKRGAGQPFISKGDIERFEIPKIPPISTQQKIVAKLDAIFAEIDKAMAAAEANAKNAEAVFQSYLTKVMEGVIKGRKTVFLGDVCKTSAGGTPLKAKKEYYENGSIPWLLSGAVCSKEILHSDTYISQLGIENSSAKIFPENTVLVAMYGATAGQVSILRFPAATNQAVCGIYPSEKYLHEFLYYYLGYYKEALLLEVSGVAQPNLSQVKIKHVPIPSLEKTVQQRIVTNLDAISIEVAKLVQSYKDKVSELKNLKQSILTKAFVDKLVME